MVPGSGTGAGTGTGAGAGAGTGAGATGTGTGTGANSSYELCVHGTRFSTHGTAGYTRHAVERTVGAHRHLEAELAHGRDSRQLSTLTTWHRPCPRHQSFIFIATRLTHRIESECVASPPVCRLLRPNSSRRVEIARRPSLSSTFLRQLEGHIRASGKADFAGR